MSYIKQLEKNIEELRRLKEETVSFDATRFEMETLPRIKSVTVVRKDVKLPEISDTESWLSFRSNCVVQLENTLQGDMRDLKKAETELNAQKILTLERELRHEKGRKGFDKEKVN